MEELDFEESSSKLTYSFEGFEGPLDLLLDLIAQKNVNIMDVKIADITDQFLQHVENMENIDMEEATAFLNMASRLLLIKSKMLLPVEECMSPRPAIESQP